LLREEFGVYTGMLTTKKPAFVSGFFSMFENNNSNYPAKGECHHQFAMPVAILICWIVFITHVTKS